MNLQRKMMRQCEVRLGSPPGEDASGLPRWKRVLDLVLIAAMLPGMLLLGFVAALVVAFGSRGPILFRQRRVGYKGREFECLKFRTMQAGAETRLHRDHLRRLIGGDVPMTKLDAGNDPRLIPLGAWLRITGLDELPQIINVLRGEMSLVGPRPCIPYEYELYEPWQRRRFEAVPGLTGLWQVSGKNRNTFNGMVQLDIEYLERMNLWLDLSIILRTLPAIGRQCVDSRAETQKQEAALSAGTAKSVELYHL